jgi:hypothetical protein
MHSCMLYVCMCVYACYWWVLKDRVGCGVRCRVEYRVWGVSIGCMNRVWGLGV